MNGHDIEWIGNVMRPKERDSSCSAVLPAAPCFLQCRASCIAVLPAVPCFLQCTVQLEPQMKVNKKCDLLCRFKINDRM